MKKEYQHIFEPFTVAPYDNEEPYHDDSNGNELRRIQWRNEFPPY